MSKNPENEESVEEYFRRIGFIPEGARGPTKEDRIRIEQALGRIPKVDPKKMEEDWNRATSKKGRPPIGGAQDD